MMLILTNLRIRGVQLRPVANWFTMGAGVIVPDEAAHEKTQ
jgi:hypothetical protein